MSLEHRWEWTGSSGDRHDEQFGDIVEQTTLSEADSYDAVLVGEPYDGGVVGRAGAREGPKAIREALATTKTHHFDAGPVDAVADLGTVDVPGGESVSAVQDAVRSVAESVHETDATPVFLGGDGSLTYANVAPLLQSGLTDGGYVTDGGFGDDDKPVGDVEHFDPTGGKSEEEQAETEEKAEKETIDEDESEETTDENNDETDSEEGESEEESDSGEQGDESDDDEETGTTDEDKSEESEIAESSVGVVSLDAHLDYRVVDGQPTSGTAYRQLLEDGLDALAVLGARHFETTTAYATELREAGGEVVTAEEVAEDTVDAAERALDAMADVESVYVSVDMDVLDATGAPGVSTPTPGGITSRELFRLLRLLAGEDRLAGVEIVETAPPLCPDGRTARTAARAVAHALSVSGT